MTDSNPRKERTIAEELFLTFIENAPFTSLTTPAVPEGVLIATPARGREVEASSTIPVMTRSCALALITKEMMATIAPRDFANMLFFMIAVLIIDTPTRQFLTSVLSIQAL